jgi:hypothetical protein
VTAGGTGLATLTAGYIPYGNGTSAFSSSANLSFDGTNLGLGGTTNTYGSQTTITLSGSNVSRIDFRSNSTFTGTILSYQSITEGLRFSTEAGYPITFYPAGTEAGRFTAAGNFGVNTNSPTSGLQTNGSSSKSAFKTPNIAEVDTISATAATGTINYDITTQSVLFYTSNARANWTVNFRGSSGTTLNTLMQTGESISATFLVTQGATAYYNSAVTIDGTSVTPKWQGGTAPTSGNASSVDCYTYVIQKTGSATYAVLASQTKFA